MGSTNFPSERSIAKLIERSNKNIVYGAHAKTPTRYGVYGFPFNAAAVMSIYSHPRADLVFDESYFPIFKDQGPQALVQAMGASHELQRAFQRLHPGPRAFTSTDLSFF